MPTVTQVLDAVRVGDVIFGLGAGGQEKLLLVYKIDPNGFSARHVTTQVNFRFDRNGRTRIYANGGYVTIVSIAPLPADMHDVAVELDRKFAARPEYPDSILSKAEIQLLLSFPKVFKRQLLPGVESIVRDSERLNGVKAILHLEWDPLHARDNPPTWNEYLSDLPALVDVLDRREPVEVVADFLAGMASKRGRTTQVAGRGKAAAASLLRLAESWT